MRLLFLVNGDARSAMGDRAQAFAARLSGGTQATIAYRESGRAGAIGAFLGALNRVRPHVIYIMDLAVAGVLATTAWRGARRPFVVIDTGDAITALAQSAGRGAATVAATGALERLGIHLADRLVVRGTYHYDLLRARGRDVTVIQDGVDLRRFRPLDGRQARAALGFGDELVVGVLGSCSWSPTLGIAYGWDLLEALGLLGGRRVKGLIIGSGSGEPHLQARARALGIADRVVFAGRRPLDELPSLLSACDICLSTQTNDLVGQVRTTGKLPLYLACGRFVLASAVGEAARVLPADMLIPYDGVVDRSYPARLAGRIAAVADGRIAHAPEGSVAIARRHFDYDMLALRLETVLRSTGAAAAARGATAQA